MEGADAEDRPEFVAAVHLHGDVRTFLPTLRSLAAHVPGPVVVGGQDPEGLLPADVYAESIPGTSPAGLLRAVWDRYRCDVLFVSDGVLVPPGVLDRVREIRDLDVRAATVCFLSNAAAFASFPGIGCPGEQPAAGHDEASITRRLRSTPPAPPPVPVPLAEGGCVVLTAAALSAVVPKDGPGGTAAETVRDFSLSARRRGFLCYLDAGTFVTRPSDLSVEPLARLVATEVLDDWLVARHPFAPALVAAETAPDSPLDLALHTARSKITGLRIVIDGACLGPHETGTQVATLSVVQALAARDDVAEVMVAIGHRPPAYAERALSSPKTVVVPLTALGRMPKADVAFRPYQPEPLFRVEPWRKAARRVLVGILDLIAYQAPGYFGTPDEWARYRASIRGVVGQVDGVVVNSQDVRRHVGLECLPVEESRLYVVPLGTDHLTGDEPARMPSELAARGFAGEEFVLTLGANYSHKNRDLAVRAHRILRQRRPDLVLVLAGAHVPHGSSAVSEAESGPGDGVYDLPNVTSAERNWLFRHAAAVLYPTSAEGFGLVPIEVARFGTPTVYVGFGPLREITGQPPVTAPDWDPDALAEAVDALMSDPELARAQVAATLGAGEKYSWSQTAVELVDVFRQMLARPSAGSGYDDQHPGGGS